MSEKPNSVSVAWRRDLMPIYNDGPSGRPIDYLVKGGDFEANVYVSWKGGDPDKELCEKLHAVSIAAAELSALVEQRRAAGRPNFGVE